MKSYRTYRISGYGYGSLTELTEVSGRYTNVVSLPVPVLEPGYVCKGNIPVARVLRHGRVKLTQVPGTDNTPGMVLSVPHRTQPVHF